MEKKLGKFILSIVLLVSDLIYSSVAVYLLKKIGIDFKSLNINIQVLIAILIHLTYMIILFIIYRKSLIDDFKDYKKNFKEYFSFGLKAWLIGLLVMVLSNMIIYNIYTNNSTNENVIQSALQKLPLYMFFSTVIYAPFTEELIFRKSIKDFINNDFIYILISGVFFGSIHLLNYQDVRELLYIIPYSAMGVSFAYIYSKKKNIFISMTFHMIHNLMIVTTSLISYFLIRG